MDLDDVERTRDSIDNEDPRRSREGGVGGGDGGRQVGHPTAATARDVRSAPNGIFATTSGERTTGATTAAHAMGRPTVGSARAAAPILAICIYIDTLQ